MSKDQVISAVGIDANIAPWAFQHYSKDFYAAYKAYQPDVRFSPARLFLICRSIELAGKSLHSRSGQTPESIKNISHDLLRSCDVNVLGTYGITLDAKDLDELKKANEYYKGKGFEYFYFIANGIPFGSSGSVKALKGWPGLPDEEQLESVLKKLLSVNL